MAYRPDGGTVHWAGWGFGGPLVGAEVEGLWPFPPATRFCLHSSPEGSGVLLGAHSLSPGFLRLCHSWLCDLRKWFPLSELSFGRCKPGGNFYAVQLGGGLRASHMSRHTVGLEVLRPTLHSLAACVFFGPWFTCHLF